MEQQLCYGYLAQMGDSKALPGFGQVDLDIEDDASARAAAAPASGSTFGQVDLEVGEPDEPQAPPSTSRVFAQGAAQSPKRGISVHDESTRIVKGDALSAMTRPEPRGAVHDDGSTRAWADIDSALADDDSFSSGTGGKPAPSASGVASKDDRVSAMRELYARGDAAGALALASTLAHTVALPSNTSSADHPDASVVIEFGEESIAADDPFGGLIPEIIVEEEAPPSSTGKPWIPTAPPPGATLTFAQRQSIPRRIIALSDLAKLDLDHRAGFLLTNVDGMQTLEEILDVCAMPAAEALALFAKLEALNAITFDE